MQQQNIKHYRHIFQTHSLIYHTDIFTKFIWGDMGEDTASISICAQKDDWKLEYIRTQNGEPFFGSGFMSNLIDQYEKSFTDEQLYQYLLDRSLCDEFELFIQKYGD